MQAQQQDRRHAVARRYGAVDTRLGSGDETFGVGRRVEEASPLRVVEQRVELIRKRARPLEVGAIVRGFVEIDSPGARSPLSL
jgi:hypothetical protein